MLNNKEICPSLPVMRKLVGGSHSQLDIMNEKLSEKIKSMKDANDQYKVVKLVCAYPEK